MHPGALILVLKILAVFALVLVNGFFVAAEFAIVKIRETQLQPLLARGHRRARIAAHVVGHLNQYLSATQLGVTLASLGLGWVGEPIFSALLGPVLDALGITAPEVRHTLAFGVGFSAITFLHITAGELAPKWFAIQNALPTALAVVQPLVWFYRVSYPFIWLINRFSLWLLRRLGIEPFSDAAAIHSEEELRLLFSASQKRSGASPLGRDIVLNALELRRRIARDVMRPRGEIVVLDTEASLADCLEIAEQSRFSRFPLCECANLDKTLGVIHIKDLYALRAKAKRAAELLPAARKLIYVPETARLERLLQLFLERKLHLAIVVDEYGGTRGMVTLENILEELVGQIQDEFDQEKPLVIRRDDQTWEVLGALPLHELSELVGEPVVGEGVSTTSGWVTRQLGGFPKEGNTLRLGHFELRVEEMDGPRVARLRLSREAAPP